MGSRESPWTFGKNPTHAHMTPTIEQLQARMAAKTDEELLAMFQKPTDWTQEALDVARAEIGNRSLPAPPPPLPDPKPLPDSTPPEASVPASQSWEIQFPDGSTRIYNDNDAVSEAVLNGDVKSVYQCRPFNRDGAEKKKQTKWKTAWKSFEIFRPVRSHMWKGVGIGAAAGILLFFGFKIVDTGAAAVMYNVPKLFGIALVYVFFFAQMLSNFASGLPKSIQQPVIALANWIPQGVVIGGVLLTVNLGTDVLSGAFQGLGGIFASFIVGALAGGLPGMAIGTCIGLVRRSRLPQPPEGRQERASAMLAAGVILPIVIFATATYFYIVHFMPWATDAFVESLK